MIPKKFSLGGFEFTVICDPSLLPEESLEGEISYKKQIIRIHKWKKGEVTKEFASQVFFHELVHGILYYIGEMELKSNEKFVDNFANHLFEYEKTKRGSHAFIRN